MSNPIRTHNMLIYLQIGIIQYGDTWHVFFKHSKVRVGWHYTGLKDFLSQCCTKRMFRIFLVIL